MTTHADSSDILTGGAWIVVRGVARWVAEPVADRFPPAEAPRGSEPLACTYCGARTTEMCKTDAGKSRVPHPQRAGPRACPCGAELGKGKTYCEPCRVEARKFTHRMRMRIRRAAA